MGCQVLHTKGKNFNGVDSHAKWGKAEQGMQPENTLLLQRPDKNLFASQF